jgi:L-lactate dehydrogenase complex protein LldG
MSAREEILGSVRRALGADGRLGSAGRQLTPVPRGYRKRPEPDDVVGLFVERVADYRAVVTRCGRTEVAEQIREALGSATRVVVPDGLGYPVPGAVRDVGQSAAELDRLDAVVTEAWVAIASTGTIVLDHGMGQGRRALSLVPDLHVCVVRENQVVAGVPEAVARLSPTRPQTWISGPSATSDIELNRVEGVHGPRNLHVIVVSRS